MTPAVELTIEIIGALLILAGFLLSHWLARPLLGKEPMAGH